MSPAPGHVLIVAPPPTASAPKHKPLTAAPLSSRRQRWEDRTPNTAKSVNNFRKMVHYQRKRAEAKLRQGLAQNTQDPVLGHLQRNMEKQYMKLWWLDAPHSSHSRPHGSMATGDRHGCIRQNMICRFFGPLRGWTPSNQLNQLKPKNSMDFVICSRSITLLCQMPGLAVRVVVEQGGGPKMFADIPCRWVRCPVSGAGS